ncbi:MAG: PEP-CTERM sorting domain-containing protein [Pirellulaceae bacterium]
MLRSFFVLLLIAFSPAILRADISYATPGSTYGNTFDSLASSGTTNAWSNDVSPFPGWYLFTGAGSAITTYSGGTGSSGTGNFWSFGTVAADRALGGVGSAGAYFGSPASGTVAGYIAVQFTNNTGVTLDQVTIRFDGEQWRNGGNLSLAAQSMVLEYGFGATFGTVGSWTAPGGNFDWTSVVNSPATAAAVDGNVAGLVAGRGGTLTSVPWLNGQSMWVRWIERNDTGNDHGLAIDRFSFSAINSVPEPSSLAVGSLVGLALAGRFRRRR